MWTFYWPRLILVLQMGAVVFKKFKKRRNSFYLYSMALPGEPLLTHQNPWRLLLLCLRDT